MHAGARDDAGAQPPPKDTGAGAGAGAGAGVGAGAGADAGAGAGAPLDRDAERQARIQGAIRYCEGCRFGDKAVFNWMQLNSRGIWLHSFLYWVRGRADCDCRHTPVHASAVPHARRLCPFHTARVPSGRSAQSYRRGQVAWAWSSMPRRSPSCASRTPRRRPRASRDHTGVRECAAGQSLEKWGVVLEKKAPTAVDTSSVCTKPAFHAATNARLAATLLSRENLRRCESMYRGPRRRASGIARVCESHASRGRVPKHNGIDLNATGCTTTIDTHARGPP